MVRTRDRVEHDAARVEGQLRGHELAIPVPSQRRVCSICDPTLLQVV